MIDTVFRRFLKVIYDTYIGGSVTLHSSKVDFIGRPYKTPLPYIVWPLDPLQTRLCGGKNQCYSYSKFKDLNINEYSTDYELTVLKTFGNRWEGFHSTCGGAFHDDLEYGPNSKESSITDPRMRVKQNLAEWDSEV